MQGIFHSDAKMPNVMGIVYLTLLISSSLLFYRDFKDYVIMLSYYNRCVKHLRWYKRSVQCQLESWSERVIKCSCTVTIYEIDKCVWRDLKEFSLICSFSLESETVYVKAQSGFQEWYVYSTLFHDTTTNLRHATTN